MNPVEVRETLLTQHQRLRALFAHALELVADDGALDELLVEVGRAFQEHNRYEESILGPMLLAQDGLGAARVNRMLEEHAGEHRAFVEQLTAEATRLPGALSDLFEEVEAHMAAEERVFLNVAVLRDPR